MPKGQRWSAWLFYINPASWCAATGTQNHKTQTDKALHHGNSFAIMCPKSKNHYPTTANHFQHLCFFCFVFQNIKARELAPTFSSLRGLSEQHGTYLVLFIQLGINLDI